jgi:hypothetical protein
LQGDEEVVTEHEGEIVELVEELVKRHQIPQAAPA